MSRNLSFTSSLKNKIKGNIWKRKKNLVVFTYYYQDQLEGYNTLKFQWSPRSSPRKQFLFLTLVFCNLGKDNLMFNSSRFQLSVQIIFPIRLQAGLYMKSFKKNPQLFKKGIILSNSGSCYWHSQPINTLPSNLN